MFYAVKMNQQVNQQTVSVGQVEAAFAVAALVLLFCALIEIFLLSSPSVYLHLPTILVALGYWTFSFRGLRMLISGLAAEQGSGRGKTLGGALLKIAALVLFGDFALDITPDKARCFFITMVGYFFLGSFLVLCVHCYLTMPARSSR